MKKTLYLHIGQHKTGTSSIQAFLDKNRKVLSQLGYCYPKSLSEARATHAFGYQLRGNKTYIGQKRVYDRSAKHMMSQLLDSKHEHSVLSSESFWRVPPEKVKAYFENFDIKVIIYLRRLDEYLMSSYSERLKGSSLKPEVRSFEQYFADESKRWRVRYDFVMDWVGAIGKENVILRPFETGQFFQHNLLVDFLNCIGLSSSIEQFECNVPRENSKLELPLSKIMLVLNRMQIPPKELRRMKVFIAAWANGQKLHGGSHWMTSAQQAELLSLVEAEEVRLARLLLNQDQLFYASPKQLVAEEELSEEEMITKALTVIIALYKTYGWRMYIPARWYMILHHLKLQIMQRFR